MTTTPFEILPVLLEAIGYGISSLLLSGIGLYIEETAITTATHGQLALGIWMALLGTLGVYAGYLMATDKFRTKFREVQMAVMNPRE